MCVTSTLDPDTRCLATSTRTRHDHGWLRLERPFTVYRPLTDQISHLGLGARPTEFCRLFLHCSIEEESPPPPTIHNSHTVIQKEFSTTVVRKNRGKSIVETSAFPSRCPFKSKMETGSTYPVRLNTVSRLSWEDV